MENKLPPKSPKTNLDYVTSIIDTAKIPIGEPLCKINIAGYSLDNFKTVNPEGYTILCNLGEVSDGFTYFTKTSKIILDTGQHSQLMHNFEKLIPSIAEELGVSEQAAFEKSVDFFSNQAVVVKPKGLQLYVYKTVQNIQNYVPMGYTSQAVALLKTTGMTGVKVITQAPLTFVGATYIGAMFFGYCGSIAGENAIGIVCNSTSYVLSRPMRGVEITLNGLILRPISNAIGIPLVLNGTQEMLKGQGLSIQEYAKIGASFERISKSKLAQKIKKIYAILRNKDKD